MSLNICRQAVSDMKKIPQIRPSAGFLCRYVHALPEKNKMQIL